ncbi:phage tail tape measure protein [Gluconobacter albidus]|uniref:Phage tail lysozyme domain-containing protein n=1 Tax=Gluconobacter albidus TaxID=318683 RepID=A0AAW3QZY3_9PROT|nr:hypothetical protein [Gluconobacter albidus]KXV39464.1 hypothetical protein AD941_05055 [Gluconobacter albidus]GBQ90966.1 hypothetical protein AA3250_2182 [Gluconobacter albidus NBRC 3250]GLQ69349.1 hypothetical protein GCM10007866_18000 [Gluconobacter albidus]
MPTILDSLVIQLGVDGRGVAKSTKQAGTALKTLEDRADHTQRTLADAGKVAADSFSRARVEAIALLGLFTGGRSIKAAVESVTQSYTQLGNAAQSLNMDPRKLTAYGTVFKTVGGNAEDAAAAIKQMQAMQYDPAQRGALSKAMSNLNVTDYLNADGTIKQDVLERINRGVQGVNQTTRNQFLPQIGISSDAAKAAVELAPKEFDRRYNFGYDNAPDQKTIDRARELTDHMVELHTQTSKFGQDLVSEYTPEIDAFVQKLLEWEKANKGIVGGLTEIAGGIVALTTVGSGLMAVIGPLLMLKNLKQLGAIKEAMCGCDCAGGPGIGGKEGKKSLVNEAEKTVERGTYLHGSPRKQALKSLLKTVGMLGLGAVDTLALPALAVYGGYKAWRPTSAGGSAEKWALDKFRTPEAHRQIRWFFGDKQGATPFEKYAGAIAGIESGGRYDIMGGANKAYAGKYQLSRDAITDAAKWLHESAPTTGQFLHDPEMQERYFQAFTEQNRKALMRDPTFAGLSEAKQYAVLGYAHNQGAGGARSWLDGGEVRHDAFGTAGTKYSDAVLAALNPPPSAANQNSNTTTNNHFDIHVTAHGNANGEQIAQEIHRGIQRALPYSVLRTQPT